MSIEKLIKKYNPEYVNGECRSTQYEKQIKRKQRLNMKLDLADGIFNELPFDFTRHQRVDVRYLIKTFPNFKELHSKASNNEIILSIIFYIRALYNQRDNDFTEPEIRQLIKTVVPDTQKQLLFPQTYEIIQWKIILHFMQKQPILPTEPRHIDHNILYKG